MAHSKNPLLTPDPPCKLTGIIAVDLGLYDTSNGYVKRYIVSYYSNNKILNMQTQKLTNKID